MVDVQVGRFRNGATASHDGRSAVDDPLWLTDAGDQSPDWARKLPVSVNDTYGDPFIPEQIANTATKLEALAGHRAPIAIFTKAGYDETVFDRIAALPRLDDVVVFYSLTGLDEGGIDFDERLRTLARLRTLVPHLAILTRPIIRNRNDSPEMLRRLAEAAAEYADLLVLGGVHDGAKRKRIERTVEDQLIGLGEELDVRVFYKTSCAAAWLHGMPCWVHALGSPRNLDALAALGYAFEADDDRIVLPRGTTGDINFVRMLCGSEVFVEDLISNYNLLTLPSGEHKLESTSSWFAWSENIETCLDCDYCIIKQIEYLERKKVTIGVHPTRLLELVHGLSSSVDFTSFRKTKLVRNRPAAHSYQDVRVTKPCRIPLYAPAAGH